MVDEFLKFVPLIGVILSIVALFWIKKVHIEINSRMSELLKQTVLASEAKGRDDERGNKIG